MRMVKSGPTPAVQGKAPRGRLGKVGDGECGTRTCGETTDELGGQIARQRRAAGHHEVRGPAPPAAATGKSRTGAAVPWLCVTLPLTVKLPPTDSVPVFVNDPAVLNDVPLKTWNVPLLVARPLMSGKDEPAPPRMTVPSFSVTETGTWVVTKRRIDPDTCLPRWCRR